MMMRRMGRGEASKEVQTVSPATGQWWVSDKVTSSSRTYLHFCISVLHIAMIMRNLDRTMRVFIKLECEE